jgi:hypothetical protein
VGKLGIALMQQYMAVVDQANKEPEDYFTTNNPNPQPGSPWLNGSQILSMAGGDAARARVIWVKLRLKQAFPETFSEATAPDGGAGMIAPDPYYSNVPTSTSLSLNQQNSICLVLALKNSSRGSVFNVDNLGSHEVAMSGNFQYIVDDWKQPVTYTKWPYVGVNPMTGNNDPSDPAGKLTSSSWSGSSTFNSMAYGAGYQAVAPPPGSSYFLSPYVWSGGPPQYSGGAATYPNPIYSYKSLVGGYSP